LTFYLYDDGPPLGGLKIDGIQAVHFVLPKQMEGTKRFPQPQYDRRATAFLLNPYYIPWLHCPNMPPPRSPPADVKAEKEARARAYELIKKEKLKLMSPAFKN
jgi:hypothetical protein